MRELDVKFDSMPESKYDECHYFYQKLVDSLSDEDRKLWSEEVDIDEELRYSSAGKMSGEEREAEICRRMTAKYGRC